MNILDNKLFNGANTVVDFITLNLIWILMCIPIITIFPATTALFGVVRQWYLKRDLPVIKTFFQLFKENLIQSMLIGVIWTIIGVALYLDYTLLTQNILLKIILLIIISIYSITTIYLFPVMVHYKNKSIYIIKNSFFLAIIRPLSLLFCFLVLFSSYTILTMFPIMIFFIGSITAYLLFMSCYAAFEKAENTNAMINNVQG